jgi:RHS repeat-associated protein
MAYNGNGQLAAVTSLVAGQTGMSGTTTFAYNAKGQLVNETSTRNGGYTGLFGYDGSGNATTFKGGTIAYDTKNQIDVAGYVYDTQGNPTTYAGAQATYDPRDRLSTFGTMTLNWMPDGKIARKQNAAGTLFYYYDGEVPVLDLNSQGGINSVNTFGHGLLSRHMGTNSRFYNFDYRGSMVQRTSVSGSVLSAHMQDAYGVQVSSATGDVFACFGAQFGNRVENDNGLILMGHRVYDPSVGRFLTRDPIGYAGGLNLYAYCNGDPINLVDPMGFDGYPWNRTMGGEGTQIVNGWRDTAKGFWGTSGAPWQFVGTVNTGIDFVCGFVTGIMGMGCGLGTYAGDPTLENAPGAIIDGASIVLVFAGGAEAAGVGQVTLEGGLQLGRPITNRLTDPGPLIKPGASGGPSAGRGFSAAVKQQALSENPNTCVYCRMQTNSPHVDHAMPRSMGGNATIANANTACPHCNLSKGDGAFPKTPPVGYFGDWPPPWWY